MTPEAICAFDRCQAGGAILAGAPRVFDPIGDRYHPGCWVAYVADLQEPEAAR